MLQDSPRQEKIAVVNYRQDIIKNTKLRQGTQAIASNHQGKIGADSPRQDKVAVDNHRQDIIKRKSEMTSESNSYSDERITSRRNKTLTKNMSSSTPKDAIKEKIKQIEQGISRMLSSVNVNESIAVHATFIRDDVSHLNNTKIVFDKVKLNLGNGYYKNAGIFIAPKAGTYIFKVTAICFNILSVSLEKNAHEVTNVLCNGDQGSGTIEMDLKVSDIVFMTLVGNAETSLDGAIYISFAGLLLN